MTFLVQFRHTARPGVALAWPHMPQAPRVGDWVSTPQGEWTVVEVTWRGTQSSPPQFAGVDVLVVDRT